MIYHEKKIQNFMSGFLNDNAIHQPSIGREVVVVPITINI